MSFGSDNSSKPIEKTTFFLVLVIVIVIIAIGVSLYFAITEGKRIFEDKIKPKLDDLRETITVLQKSVNGISSLSASAPSLPSIGEDSSSPTIPTIPPI